MALSLTTYTIYDRPLDYPDRIVVRSFEIVPGAGEPVPGIYAHLFDTIEAAREWIASKDPTLFCLHRNPDDDAPIVETWI